MLASTFTHDRGVAGSRQDLLHVLPVAGSDKMWYLNAARARLLHGVWEPPQRVQPRHDRTRRLVRTGSQRHHFHPSWWSRAAKGTVTRFGHRAAEPGLVRRHHVDTVGEFRRVEPKLRSAS